MNSYFIISLKFKLENPNHKSHYIFIKSFKIHMTVYAKIILKNSNAMHPLILNLILI